MTVADPSPGAPLSAADRLDIADAVGGIMLLVDMKDWAAILGHLLPDVTTDYTSVFGGEPVSCSREDLVRGWSSRLPGFDATQHTVTQVCVRGSGSQATTVSNLRAAHWIEGRIWAFGGTYHHTLTRTDHGWRIGSLRIAMYYEEGDRAVRAQAIERMAAKLGSTVDDLTLIGRGAQQVGT
jgi:hypothetical protein